ncbi:MAG: succinate dehydrogenase, cytochrome b556 subunit [Gammaproteobacteria bacterium]|nr:succinate dehydrogenase, cytochrome b556 subunit [Gammaproteobacteria bacterium]
MTQPDRPLSPHLGVYRWQVSNTLSIVHRLTGVMLSAGAVVFTAWLVATAGGPDAYLGVVGVLRSPPGVLALVGWTFCFFYHLCNGIRHLCWDAGYGFGISQARASGFAVVAAAVLLTVVFWLVVAIGNGS